MTHWKKYLSWEWAPFFIGFILRLRQYLSGRSLWADEAMLALNIVNRNFAGMFQPLEYNQGAPLGFLLIEKFFNALFGRQEIVLRFFPFLMGIASLALFCLLAKKMLQGAGLYLAPALFAVNPQLIDYSVEAKQYIVDAAAAIGLMWFAFPIFQRQFNRKDFILLAIAGVAALWVSHPALFVLAGIGAALVVQFLQAHDYRNLQISLGVGLLWLINLTLLYFLNLRQLSHNTYLTGYWSDGFLPLPPWNDFNWLRELIVYQFSAQFLPLLVSVLIFIGWLALCREQKNAAIAFGAIALFAFTASALTLYPVNGRLSLFLIPLGILLLGKALDVSQKIVLSNRFASVGSAILLSGYLLINPLIVSAQNFIAPKYVEHIRPTMEVLANGWKDGDVLFVTAWAEPAFRFYAPFYKLENVAIATSNIEDYPDGEKLIERIQPLVGKKRVWVLFSHVYEQGGFNERDYLIAYLNTVGEKKREILKSGSSVYLFLYDLSK